MPRIQQIVDFYTEKFKKESCIAAIQIGSSLRKKEFFGNSDIDFLVIYRKSIRNWFKLETKDSREINILRRSEKQFVNFLKEGNPVDLIALNFGKILFDKNFLKKLKFRNFRPTSKTIDAWMHTASFNFSDAVNNYPYPFCLCCYFKSLHHAVRDFSRAIILKETNKLLEGDFRIAKELSKRFPQLSKDYKLILDGRKDYEKFRPRLELRKNIIKNSGIGEYILAAENIARTAFQIVYGLRLPTINKLISQLSRMYKIRSYHVWLISERKNLEIGIFTEDNKYKHIEFNLGVDG